jgi:hypothetical protein
LPAKTSASSAQMPADAPRKSEYAFASKPAPQQIGVNRVAWSAHKPVGARLPAKTSAGSAQMPADIPRKSKYASQHAGRYRRLALTGQPGALLNL